MNKALIIIIVAFASLSHLKSQTTISAQLRPRTEFRHGYKTLAEKDQDPAFFTSQRSRLNLKTQGEKFLLGISLQDVRTWGATEQLNASDDFFSLHEAWGEYFFTDHFSLKAGRQEVAYDNQRMFGSVNWAQQGRSHDLALLKYQNDSYKIHFGAAFNQENERLFETTYALNNYKTMQYIWFHQELTALSFSALFINNGLQTTDNVKYSHTLGGYAKGDVEGIQLEGSLYYQFGKDGNNRSLSALQFSMDAILTLNEEVNIVGGIEHLSGTKDSEDTDRSRSFAPLFGTNHKFNGHMDYFYTGGPQSKSVGLNDFHIKALYKKEKLQFNSALHFFTSAAKFTTIEEPADEKIRSLGFEIDLSAGYKFSEIFTVNAGYSQMIPGEAMVTLKGGDKSAFHNWTWIMLSFSPEILRFNP